MEQPRPGSSSDNQSHRAGRTDRGAVVLCGGGSRRMGRDKAWLPFGSHETMLQRTVRLVSEAVPAEHVVVVAGATQKLPSLPQQTAIIRDEQPDAGPLPALAHGLEALADRAEFAFVTAADAPLLQPTLVTAILDDLRSARSEAPANPPMAVAPRDAKRSYPLAAAYHTFAAAEVRAALARGVTALNAFLGCAIVHWIDAASLRSCDPSLHSLLSCNTPQQYQDALKLMSESDDMPNQLIGDWAPIRSAWEESSTPEEELRDVKLAFREGRCEVRRGEVLIRAGDCSIDATQSPPTIDVHFTDSDVPELIDAPLLGIYEVNGDSLRICYGPPGGSRATSFSAAKGTMQYLGEYRRLS